MELTEPQLLQSIWMALRRIEDNLALPPAPLELPEFHVDPPDLTAIVTAVSSLNGTGPSAEDIASAIRDVLTPQPADPGAAVALGEIARALEKLDFRMQGLGKQAYGGGSVSFSDAGMRQLIEALDGLGGGGGGTSMTIAEEGVGLTARTTLNFVGDAVTAADDAANTRTNVTVALRLRSPNGTLFELSVANDGTLTAASV